MYSFHVSDSTILICCLCFPVIAWQGSDQQFWIRTKENGKEAQDGMVQDHSRVYRIVPSEKESIKALQDHISREPLDSQFAKRVQKEIQSSGGAEQKESETTKEEFDGGTDCPH